MEIVDPELLVRDYPLGGMLITLSAIHVTNKGTKDIHAHFVGEHIEPMLIEKWFSVLCVASKCIFNLSETGQAEDV